MRILHDNETIYFSMYESEYYYFTHPNITITLSELTIDEIPDNKNLCLDLKKFGNNSTVDINGLPKYYIQNNELYERDGWIYTPKINVR